MNPTVKSIFTLMSFAFFLALGIASSPSAKTYSDADRWIPPSFAPGKSVLLIQTHPVSGKQNDRMIEYLQKNYPYSFEVVDTKDIESKTGKYADTKKYPFVVLWNLKQSTIREIKSNGMISERPAFDLYGHFVERSNGNVYAETKNSNVYGQVGYKPFFNSIVKRYK